MTWFFQCRWSAETQLKMACAMWSRVPEAVQAGASSAVEEAQYKAVSKAMRCVEFPGVVGSPGLARVLCKCHRQFFAKYDLSPEGRMTTIASYLNLAFGYMLFVGFYVVRGTPLAQAEQALVWCSMPFPRRNLHRPRCSGSGTIPRAVDCMRPNCFRERGLRSRCRSAMHPSRGRCHEDRELHRV